ncbi:MULTISPECIES: ABC transporter ATP-binding protein [Halobacterium]|uniref:ABC-type transport system ATP-binding/permease protein n=1 Tax=Halobacterium salinarum (strain ATCC 33171 / DSM 3754 / JCM 8978 / NBRC 102687 / NCIMB 764 / 91-R6) TaxID=2597657 RepID=A0A4D6GQP3_HALS9|nr:ABC transporter ATP-binding protein [Halobacterium salinarum]MDL0124706.1 ABC transporter ATP-binding protein [Halobacterium salinarum]MDL0130840.1 ABC transporter ATP-binding protein [Halobacterium salinarum]MDL0133754.1 ABC transporter ATP-binding protein [Halobacterium salinarum]MDL0137737.1 ABC transporter ATP-binding protein [Halobacterium salinarum]MDL0140396.1 ABC transporter ATP-binding protein [Halobacterium salinarum]
MSTAPDNEGDDDPFEEQRADVDNAMVQLFDEYGRDHSFQAVVAVLASVFARVLDLAPPVLLGLAIDSVIQGNKAFLPFLPQSVVPSSKPDRLLFMGGLIAGSFLLGAAFHWIRNWGFNSFSQHIQHRVRTDTYDKMQRLNMDFFATKQTGEMMSILSNDVNRLERFLNDGLNSAFRLSVMVLAIGVYLFVVNWQLAVLTMLPVPIIALFTYRFVNAIQPKYADVRSSVGHLNSRLENNLGGIQVIKTSNTERYESDRVDDVSQGYFDANWGAITIRIKFFPALRIISGVGFVLTFVIGGIWVATGPPMFFSGTLDPGEFVTFILLSQQFIWPMAQFGQIINMYQRARASSERIFGLMNEPSRIEENPDADELVVDDGGVVYDDVSFGYDDDDAIVEHIDFQVDGGDTLALVGPTGAGKSTVLKLLLRMYDVDAGAVRVDGQDISGVTLPSLRRHVGYVSQDTFLFYGTVEENITYGTFDADREAVVDAAKAAEAHEFIQNLPDGYDTEVGERGVKLSGGQRQRIDIARAILKDPEILVLDEATSDVDTETEMLIQRSLDRLTEDRTTFSIAHRLSTIKDADQIVVLEDGEIVERGTHADLLGDEGLYANLWGVQAGEIDELPDEFIERAAKRQATVDDQDDD